MTRGRPWKITLVGLYHQKTIALDALNNVKKTYQLPVSHDTCVDNDHNRIKIIIIAIIIVIIILEGVHRP